MRPYFLVTWTSSETALHLHDMVVDITQIEWSKKGPGGGHNDFYEQLRIHTPSPISYWCHRKVLFNMGDNWEKAWTVREKASQRSSWKLAIKDVHRIFFWDRVSLCITGWSRTHNPPAPTPECCNYSAPPCSAINFNLFKSLIHFFSKIVPS
jgi:hypothetical protein